MSRKSIKIEEHDPAWTESFLHEAERLRNVLGACALDVHHIGSTSVPGLAAKPVIDILLEVASLAELDAKESAMSALGYKAKGENGIRGRRYYQLGEAVRTHQVHAFVRGDENVRRHLAFRDYLRTHALASAEYARVKKEAAAVADGDSAVYCAMKDGFIKAHERFALDDNG